MSNAATGTSATLKELKQACWDEEIYARATTYIFERRRNVLRNQLLVLDLIHVITPTLLGLLILGPLSTTPRWLVVALGLLAIAGSAITTVGIVMGWSRRLSEAHHSHVQNLSIADAYERLVKSPPKLKDTFMSKKAAVDARNEVQTQSDGGIAISQHEKAFGHRAAHRHRKRPCAGCDKVPLSLRSSDCSVCGSFKLLPFVW